MTPLVVVCLVLVVHFIADFVMQSDWMAKNKSSNDIPLLCHVMVYSMMMFFLSLVLLPPVLGVLWALSNGVFHFATDWITSRVTSSLWKKQRVHDFFVVIGLDQLIHYITLFVTLSFFMRNNALQ